MRPNNRERWHKQKHQTWCALGHATLWSHYNYFQIYSAILKIPCRLASTHWGHTKWSILCRRYLFILCKKMACFCSNFDALCFKWSNISSDDIVAPVKPLSSFPEIYLYIYMKLRVYIYVYIWWYSHRRHTTTEEYENNIKIDTFDWIMITKWALSKFTWSPKLR